MTKTIYYPPRRDEKGNWTPGYDEVLSYNSLAGLPPNLKEKMWFMAPTLPLDQLPYEVSIRCNRCDARLAFRVASKFDGVALCPDCGSEWRLNVEIGFAPPEKL